MFIRTGGGTVNLQQTLETRGQLSTKEPLASDQGTASIDRCQRGQARRQGATGLANRGMKIYQWALFSPAGQDFASAWRSPSLLNATTRPMFDAAHV